MWLKPVLCTLHSMYIGIHHIIIVHGNLSYRPKSKQGDTTNLNISFSMENEKKAAQVGLEPTTYCLRGRCSTHWATEAAQLAGLNQGKGNQSNLT